MTRLTQHSVATATIGTVGGRGIPYALIEPLLGAAALAPDSPQWRRHRRWCAQVVLTHELLHEEFLAGRREDVSSPSAPESFVAHPGLFGSIAWTALRMCRCGGEVLRSFRSPAAVSPAAGSSSCLSRHLLLALTGPHSGSTFSVTDDGIPGPFGDAVRAATPNATVLDPRGVCYRVISHSLISHSLMSHSLISHSAEPTRPVADEAQLEGVRLHQFSDWLDALFLERVVVQPGFEHPGDPRQPDYTHHH